jgi:hypothetical protein
MKTFAQFREQAAFLRESSGSTNIEKALLKALKVLKLFNIPHSLLSGYKSNKIIGLPGQGKSDWESDG